MKKRLLSIISAVLALSLLAGCGSAAKDTEPDPVEGVLAGEELGVSDAADDIFSLNYNSSASLDPYATNDTNNLLISQLVFDNIFELSDDYELSSRIITSYSSENGSYWTFTVDTSIKMHDGTNLTASDVSYSIQRAKQTSRYSGRFTYTYGVSATSEDTFVVNLGKADWLFPYLLNIPVVKDGSAGTARPVGSGPYKYVEDADYVEAFSGYVNYQTLPVDRIYFKEYSEAVDIITAFEDSYLDLIVNDPSGSGNFGYGGNTETRYYTTTNMHYFGFNMASEFVNNAQLRYVLQLAVDREYAADTLMGNGAVASCLPVSPLSPLYDESVARELKFDLELCARLLDSLDVKDTNGDGKREYVEYSQLKEIGIDLIVCSESAGKGDIAKQFASDLASIGVTVNVRELSWTDYQNALMNGDFDMYYADYRPGVKLYVKRVYITDDDKDLLPTYLRFVRGIIDSEDLPLNVSREILQENRVMVSIRNASVKKLLGEFRKISENNPELYAKFIAEYNRPLKEGLYSDYANRDTLLELVRYKSSTEDGYVSLKEYKEGIRSAIFFYVITIVMTGPLRSAIAAILLALLVVAFHNLRVAFQRVQVRLFMR